MFSPENDRCDRCKDRLHVKYTGTRAIVTLHIGQFTAREIVLFCPKCQRVYISSELRNLVPSGCNFGYDIMVYVGLAIFVRYRKNEEIINELAARNVLISSSEIDYLGKKFITYLALAHQQSTGRIQRAMRLNGGYILHLDATYEDKSPLLMTGLDSLSEIILSNIKIPSENADDIIPFLVDIRERFGDPIALVHDMGAGIMKAVNKVFGKILDFICHYHFLRDIGKDLLDDEYDRIRKRLKHHGVTKLLSYHARMLKSVIDENPFLIDTFCYTLKETHRPQSDILRLVPAAATYNLIHWALDGKKQGQGYGFPFDRGLLTFVQRLKVVYDHLEQLKDIRLRQDEWADNKPYYKIYHLLAKVCSDKTLACAVTDMEEKVTVFDKLRDAMRVAPKSGRLALNEDGLNANIETIEKDVKKFRTWLSQNRIYSSKKVFQKMITQIDKYWDKLFADPITVDTPNGKIVIQPQRTNNILERLFRDIKRDNRRKTGNSSLGRKLRAMLADTPLVKNLANPRYMKMLLNDHDNLEQLFALINTETARDELRKAQTNPEKIPSKFKKLISKPTFADTLINAIKTLAAA